MIINNDHHQQKSPHSAGMTELRLATSQLARTIMSGVTEAARKASLASSRQCAKQHFDKSISHCGRGRVKIMCHTDKEPERKLLPEESVLYESLYYDNIGKRKVTMQLLDLRNILSITLLT
jgi:hypothetical protein